MRFAALLVVLLAVSRAGAAEPDPPVVILDLGEVLPTPAPTPEQATRRRLISTITVQNAPDGQSIISFEATDVADQGERKFLTLAAARYSLAERPAKLEAMRWKIIKEVRDLERDLLEYAKIAGPPKERESVVRMPGRDSGRSP